MQEGWAGKHEVLTALSILSATFPTFPTFPTPDL
jgi:hypothetical protein